MELLEQRILRDGKVRPGGILKVDSFLNHQIDTGLLYEMALEVKRLFDGERIDKVLTVEASGIAIACMIGYVLGCPAVFAKKSRSRNISDAVYSYDVPSFTHGNVNTIIVSKEYLHEGERVLLADDFLATGAALRGLAAIVAQAGGTVVGAVCEIEKKFQGGGSALRAEGMRVEALAKIASMSDDGLEFCR